MRVPFSWLRDFAEIPDDSESAAEKLRRAGVPVERVEHLSPGVGKIYAGKILTLEPHPQADKLRVAQVDLGSEKLQIITGAPNVARGDVVPVARVGSMLADGKNIKEASLRGLPSHGMMCSADELGLDFKEYLPQAQHEGVMILDSETPPGSDLSALLGLNEAVLVVEPFANRPDYLSVYGIAREAAAIYGTRLQFPAMLELQEGDLGSQVHVSVEDFQACPRYVARLISGVKVRPSPLWMAVRLYAAGIRPINNIVDITNYVLLELGQPLHAFDFRLVADGKIVVRKARAGERFTAIDGESHDLSESMLVIADGKGPAALGGIIGGKNSEISDATAQVLLESANFEPGLIRRTALVLGVRTESSRRFEKGLDPVGADWGSRRAAYLFTKEGAVVEKGALDCHERLPKPKEIHVSLSRVRNLIGLSEETLSASDVERLLKGLGFQTKKLDVVSSESFKESLSKSEFFLVETPPLRLDIHEEVDVAEEVARHYGYDRIPSTLPRGLTTPAWVNPEELFEERVRNLFQNLGLMEIVTLSLGDPAYFGKFHAGALSIIQNPLTEDRRALRPLLYPGLLSTLRKNLHVKNKDLSLFEIGKVFRMGHGVEERRHAAAVLCGKLPWGSQASFLSMKGMLEKIWEGLHIPAPFTLRGEAQTGFHPLRFGQIHAGGASVGFLAELHPLLLEELDIPQPAILLEIFLEELSRLEGEIKVRPVPIYPSSRRDVSLVVDERVPAGEVLDMIRAEGGACVEEVNVFDVYQGPQIPPHKKSLAFAILYRSAQKTLTDEEVAEVHERVKARLAQKFDATLRV